MQLLTAVSTAFIVSLLLNLVMIRRPEWLPLDKPNERSLHTRPTPRSGGLGIMVGIMVASLVGELGDWLWVMLITFGLAAMSLLDDLRDLPAGIRFGGHMIAAIAFLSCCAPSEWSWPMLGVALLGVVWLTNLYNFMDGSDGLAGGMASIGFGVYGLAAWAGGDMSLAVISWVIMAAAVGFLLFNLHPARIFMGDIGSIPLGFAAAALGLAGSWRGQWPLTFPLLVFSPFIVDASVTLMHRALQREKVWQAHKSHYYQRLVRMGWGHKVTALFEYTLMFLCALSGLWLVQNTDYEVAVVVTWTVVYIGCMVLVDIAWNRHEKI